MARPKLAASRPTLLAAATLGAVCAAACFPDWDRLDPSQAQSAGGAGQGGEGVAGGTFCEPGETAPCYGGPEGTENVGACVGGVTTCNAEGSGFGPCEGEVQPIDEDCDNQSDDDCDGEINELDAGCSCTPGELVACYEGPTGTEGEGICVGGEKLCGPTGDTFTACVGQVVPMHEECTTPADDDCDGGANEGCPTWGKAFGVNGMDNDDVPWGLATLANGDFYVAGIARGSLNFGVTGLSPLGGADGFVAKLDTDGDEIWAQRIGSAGHEEILTAAADAAGNVYVAGEFASTIPFGSVALDLTAVGTEDGWLAKIDPDGTVLWTASIGGSTADVTVLDIAVDAAGNVAVTGDFSTASPGTIDFGSGPQTSTGGGFDGFVQKYDAAGNLVWGTAFGASGNDVGRAVAFVGTSLAISGTFDTSVSFGGPSASDTDGKDAFIAMVDATNAQQWIVTVGNQGDQSVNDLASDGTHLYALGEGDGVIDIDGNPIAAQADDLFVLALDAGGNILWSQHYVGPNDQHTGGLAANATTVWFGSSHDDLTDYGDGPMLASVGDDWGLVKLDAATGNTLLSVRVGGAGDDDPRALGMDSQGALYVTGDCRGDIDFGFGPIPLTTSYEDICIGKLPP